MFEIASDGPGPAAYDLSSNLKQKPMASRSGTFGTASRFTKGGRVYQPVKRFHFRSALSKSDQGEAAPTPPVPLPTSSPPETRATTPTPGRVRAIREKIMVKKSISVQIRKERERKRELWLRKLMARDFAALAADAMTAYQPEEEQRRKIQMMWVGLMMVASRAAWVGTVVDTYHANKDWILKVRWAVDVLQRWARRMSRKRRRAYQRRVEERFGRVWLLRLRQRQMREVITRKYQAAEVIKCMLQFERRKLLRGVKLFRHKITQLQRFWRGYLVQRNALADVIERQWVVLEQQVVSAYVDDEVKAISKATKSVKKRTATAAIREAVPVPRVDDAMRRIGTIVLARDVYREYVARTRAWLALEATEGRTGEPWIRAIVAPQRLLKAIKLAQQAALDDVIPPETKAKLAVIINRFVADLASHEIGVY
ncbi:hypothetical protein PBRA_002858 [Plasmodiophora brassicae]|nr:hypothetical protein PBRA_002858 [Plasmodiophora brassicae]